MKTGKKLRKQSVMEGKTERGRLRMTKKSQIVKNNRCLVVKRGNVLVVRTLLLIKTQPEKLFQKAIHSTLDAIICHKGI